MDFSESETFVTNVNQAKLIKPQPDRASRFAEIIKFTSHPLASANVILVSTSSKEDVEPVQPVTFMKPQSQTVFLFAEPIKFTPSRRKNAFAAKAFTWFKMSVASVAKIKFTKFLFRFADPHAN